MIPEYPSAPVQPLTFKDRRTGLVIFGILSCLIGGFAALGALAMPLALATSNMVPKTPGVPQPDARSMIVGAIIYVGIAVLFVWLGVDSFRTKRWVRPIVLTVGWTWLILGVCGMVMLAFTAPHLMDMMSASAAAQGGPGLPKQFGAIMFAVVIATSAVIYLLLPIAYLLFYSGRNVKATLEYFDPELSWTERVPVQVLGLSVGLALGAVSTLASMPFAVFPVFGMILTGLSAIFCILLVAALLAWAAVLTYQQRMIGWWMTTVLTIVLAIGLIISLSRHSLVDIYRDAGFPQETLDMMQAYSSGGNIPSIIAMSVLTVACLAYMLYVLKYFRRSDEAIATSSSSAA